MIHQYKHQFMLIGYVVIFIIFFALAMYIISFGSVAQQSISAVGP